MMSILELSYSSVRTMRIPCHHCCVDRNILFLHVHMNNEAPSRRHETEEDCEWQLHTMADLL